MEPSLNLTSCMHHEEKSLVSLGLLIKLVGEKELDFNVFSIKCKIKFMKKRKKKKDLS